MLLNVSKDTVLRIENDKNTSINTKVDVIKKLSLTPSDDYSSFICNSFGSYIMKERIRIGMTQEELAAKINVSHKTIVRWEREYSIPSYNNYTKIRLIFDSLKQ